tara:strand:- start:248 stop:433 length:186 start_codon:yes stop_codon:yes gene_type:complete
MDISTIDSVKKYIVLGNTSKPTYELTLTDSIKIYVPHATDNTDYQAILAWVADGNTIEEAD